MILIKFIVSTVLLVQIYCGAVPHARKTCSDCVAYTSCPGALHLLKSKRDRQSADIFLAAACSSQNEDKTFKVCCSEFPVITDNIEESFDESKQELLPKNCGRILSSRLLGNSRSMLYEFPWMALIAYRTRDGVEFQCTGSIINSRYILTAAHCVINMNIMGVRVGEYDIGSTVDCYGYDNIICEEHIQDIQVEDKIIHPYYQQTDLNDIALLRLKDEIYFTHENVKPICLPLSKELRNNRLSEKMGVVAGWDLNTGRSPSTPQRTYIPLHDDCSQYVDRVNSVRENSFCATQNRDECVGNSGAPLLVEAQYNSTTRYVQYGVQSVGSVTCRSSAPLVYTDVRKFVNWILQTIKE